MTLDIVFRNICCFTLTVAIENDHCLVWSLILVFLCECLVKNQCTFLSCKEQTLLTLKVLISILTNFLK